MNGNVYLSKLLELRRNFTIKLISGFRGVGKLDLLKMFAECLKNEGVREEQIVFVNFEVSEQMTDFQNLYSYVNKKIESLDYAYLLFYGIQRVTDWEKAVNAFFLGAPVEIYIADSNEKLLSEKIICLLPDNCDAIKIYPLSFSEYIKSVSLDMNNFSSEKMNVDALFDKYLRFGGMSVTTKYSLEENLLNRLLNGILYEALLKDVTIKYSLRNPYLFYCILRFLALNLSSPIKLKNLEQYFGGANQVATAFTLDNYLNIIDESEFFKKVPRYDLKKETFINGNECFYCIDSGLCNALNDFKIYNETALIKNIVYLELLRRGYKVYTPVIGTMTADFLAVSDKKEICIQVLPAEMNVSLGKILRPLNKLPDSTDKILISKNFIKVKNGIKNITVTDFLLDSSCY